MKTANCYNCESSYNSFYAEENGFTLVKCQKCGLLFIEKMPSKDKISLAQQQGQHKGDKEINTTGIYYNDKIHQYFIVLNDLFKEDLNNKKTWLDIGCGHGEFMEALIEFSNGNLIIKGSEPNIYKQESALSRNLDVSFIDIETHKEKYDVISILNVFSHLPNPPLFIESLKKLLTPFGELIIETGNSSHLKASDHYRPFYLPDHLSFASEKIVVNILKRHGFEIIRIKKYPFHLVRFNFKKLVKEFIKLFLPSYKSELPLYLKWRQSDMYLRARLRS